MKKGMFETIYDVDHVTGWSVLWMSGEFITRLRVTENRASKSVNFKLLHSDMMRDFDGHWTLQPATQSGLNKLYGKGGSPFDGLVGAFQGSITDMHKMVCSIVFHGDIGSTCVQACLERSPMRACLSSIRKRIRKLLHLLL